MSHAVVYGGQSSYQVTRGGPDGTGRPPREWTSLYQGTTYGASGYKSHIHAMERPVPIVPASPRPATSKSHRGYTRVVALDAACWLLSQKAFTFGVQELFDFVHLSGLDVDHLLG